MNLRSCECLIYFLPPTRQPTLGEPGFETPTRAPRLCQVACDVSGATLPHWSLGLCGLRQGPATGANSTRRLLCMQLQQRSRTTVASVNGAFFSPPRGRRGARTQHTSTVVLCVGLRLTFQTSSVTWRDAGRLPIRRQPLTGESRPIFYPFTRASTPIK